MKTRNENATLRFEIQRQEHAAKQNENKLRESYQQEMERLQTQALFSKQEENNAARGNAAAGNRIDRRVDGMVRKSMGGRHGVSVRVTSRATCKVTLSSRFRI